MTELQLIQVFASLGALGIITFLFIKGELISKTTVEKIMNAQANHIGDLREVTEKHLKEIKDILKEIRDNRSM